MQTFLDLISNEKSQIRYISVHDASYKRIIPAAKAETDKIKKEMKEDEKRELAQVEAEHKKEGLKLIIGIILIGASLYGYGKV